MSRVPESSTRGVVDAAQSGINAYPDGYAPASAAAALLYEHSPVPILDVGPRLRAAAHAGRVRALRIDTKRYLYRVEDVLAEAEYLTRLIERRNARSLASAEAT